MSAGVVWLLVLLLVAAPIVAWEVRQYRVRRRWAAEDDAYQPILPRPNPSALFGTPVITSNLAPRGSGYVMNGEHGRVLVLHPDDLERIKRPGRPRPLPYPRPLWPNTAATAAAAGEAWGTSSRPPLTDDDGGRRGD